MSQTVDIRELNERIESKSSFVNMITMGMDKVIVGQKHLFFRKILTAGVYTDKNLGNIFFICIFRKNCASVPEERSAIPLQTEQSSAG